MTSEKKSVAAIAALVAIACFASVGIGVYIKRDDLWYWRHVKLHNMHW